MSIADCTDSTVVSLTNNFPLLSLFISALATISESEIQLILEWWIFISQLLIMNSNEIKNRDNARSFS